MRPTQLITRHADDIQQIARLLQIHRHAARNILHLPYRADQKRRRNGDRIGRALRAELVIKTVLAAYERCVERDGHVVTGLCRPDERAERFWAIAIAPAEVIENGD